MKNYILKIFILFVVPILMLFFIAGCDWSCKKPCSSNIEVGVCPPKDAVNKTQCGGCWNGIKVLTWEPITNFPRHTNLEVTDGKFKPLRPYLFKANITNYSDIEVRGVTVAFYWASFGHFDKGTPIGAVGVDLKPNSTQWVRSPWAFTLGGKEEYNMCVSVRVFHPCDTELKNNICYRNFLIVPLLIELKYYIIPFVVDYTLHEGSFDFKINTPDGIKALIVQRKLPEGATDTLRTMPNVEHIDVKKGQPQDFSLIIENVGRQLNLGDTLDVTVTSIQRDKEIGSFTVQYIVSDERFQEQTEQKGKEESKE